MVMATAGGNWKSLAEASLLTRGVLEEAIFRMNPFYSYELGRGKPKKRRTSFTASFSKFKPAINKNREVKKFDPRIT